jgi:hypothetical protein
MGHVSYCELRVGHIEVHANDWSQRFVCVCAVKCETGLSRKGHLGGLDRLGIAVETHHGKPRVPFDQVRGVEPFPAGNVEDAELGVCGVTGLGEESFEGFTEAPFVQIEL